MTRPEPAAPGPKPRSLWQRLGQALRNLFRKPPEDDDDWSGRQW